MVMRGVSRLCVCFYLFVCVCVLVLSIIFLVHQGDRDPGAARYYATVVSVVLAVMLSNEGKILRVRFPWPVFRRSLLG